MWRHTPQTWGSFCHKDLGFSSGFWVDHSSWWKGNGCCKQERVNIVICHVQPNGKIILLPCAGDGGQTTPLFLLSDVYSNAAYWPLTQNKSQSLSLSLSGINILKKVLCKIIHRLTISLHLFVNDTSENIVLHSTSYS